MKKYIIRVTQQDIKNGVRTACRCCPVAIAASRDTGHVISVAPSWLFYSQADHTEQHVILPGEVTGRILAFDAGCGMEPFEFAVEF